MQCAKTTIIAEIAEITEIAEIAEIAEIDTRKQQVYGGAQQRSMAPSTFTIGSGGLKG